MTEHEKFLLFVASYVAALTGNGPQNLISRKHALSLARELGWVSWAHRNAEPAAWEFALWVAGLGSRPQWSIK